MKAEAVREISTLLSDAVCHEDKAVMMSALEQLAVGLAENVARIADALESSSPTKVVISNEAIDISLFSSFTDLAYQMGQNFELGRRQS